MANAEVRKVTVVLNAAGQVAAAAKQPTTGSAEAFTSGLVAGLGQMLVEVEVPAHVEALDGDKLLAHLASHASVQQAMGSSAAMQAANVTPTSGEAVSGSF